jgi:DNA-binding XRE family transcriptional regulator
MTPAQNNASPKFLLDVNFPPFTVAAPMSNPKKLRARKLPRVRRHYLEHRIADTKASLEALKRFAVCLRELRLANGLTLNALAREVGCSANQIYNMEHAQNWPSMAVYLSLCRVFKQPQPPMM